MADPVVVRETIGITSKRKANLLTLLIAILPLRILSAPLVLCAKNLPKTDTLRRAPNTYVVLSIEDSEQFRTGVCERSTDPRWDQPFAMYVIRTFHRLPGYMHPCFCQIRQRGLTNQSYSENGEGGLSI